MGLIQKTSVINREFVFIIVINTHVQVLCAELKYIYETKIHTVVVYDFPRLLYLLLISFFLIGYFF